MAMIIIREMKRKISLIFILSLLTFGLFAANLDSASISANKLSAFRNISYSGNIEDIFINPASLPLIREDILFKASLALSETYDSSVLFSSSPTSHIQNLKSEFQGTVLSSSMAITAKFSNYLSSRYVRDNSAFFNIFTGIDIELDLGYKIGKSFAIGFSIGGGNSLIRDDKKISSYLDVVQNALFSPYERIDGSERFTSSLGIMFFNDNLSFGLTTSSLIGVDISVSNYFSNLIGNTTIGFSYRGDMYSEEGDLNILVPRIGASIKGMGVGEERSVSLSGDLTMQMLKNAYIDGGVKYQYFVNSDGINSILSFSLLGTLDDFSLSFNVAFDFLGDYDFLPSVVFTYCN